MSNKMAGPEKEAYVENLFSSIAPKYDLLNTVLSLCRHKAWRRYAVSQSGLIKGDSALDICCGTGDFAFDLARRAGEGGEVVGVDFSIPMIELAKRKARKCGLEEVRFLAANACRLPFPDRSFNCVTVGFGLRNIADVDAAIAEMTRVTRPGGKVISLEICGIRSPILYLPWKFYFHTLAPCAAAIFRTRRAAYEYLPRSVDAFMSREELARRFERAGLKDVRWHDLNLGAVCLHLGIKA